MRNPLTIIKEKIQKLDSIEKKVDKLLANRSENRRGPEQPAEILQQELQKKQKLLKSSLCKELDFHQPWYAKWCAEINQKPAFHRKQWEFAYILQALHERGMLQEGKKGLGFAVGSEQLPALFAKYKMTILATDLDPEQGAEKGWTTGDQLCYGVESFAKHGIASLETLQKYVTYRAVDMNNIPDDLKDFDFTWSACAFEHLGSIENGLKFVENQMKTLKPGGYAIHSSEYNISSNDDTVENENLVLFRQRDYQELAERLRKQGHFVEELDFSLGWLPTDYFVDVPPYLQDKHLRLQIDRFVTSSFCLIIRKKL